MKVATFVFVLFYSITAFAQTTPEPIDTARLRIGPVGMSPSVGLVNIGVDTNIFNEVDTSNPKSDFTATLTSQIPMWLRLGKGRLSATTRNEYAYFAQYATERAVNTYNDARLELPLTHVTPYVSGGFIYARERPGYEIDKRARRAEGALSAGADVRLGPKSSAGFAAWRRRLRFSSDDLFQGTSLQESLNRTESGERLVLRYKVTPLTTLLVLTETQRDRFEFSPLRDSNSVRVMPGVEFSQFTLITGNARIGYRRYDSPTDGAPPFAGFVATADLGYTLRGVTHLSLHTERDLGYSYDITWPYYIQSGVSGTITQKITGRWDAQATLGHYRLTYQEAASANVTGPTRLDNLRSLGGGVGYKIGPDTRLGLDVTRYRRDSNRDADYNSLRFGTSVTYGF
jgi:Putative beta-barrel porin 2